MHQAPLTLAIRRFSNSDHDQVWWLHNAALEGTAAHLGNGPWDDDLHKIPEVYFRGGDFLVGEYEGRILAMGAIRRKTDECAEVKRMRVHPEFQRRGLGQQIVNALERRANTLGYSVLCLDTTVQQVAAQNFYLKNGFRET